ncbi:MAG: HAMP domain-containing histidine kinase [Staphylococcus sp.]|nr:HAMP domain-containing histidine kinase [Staphylococcus sp.]
MKIQKFIISLATAAFISMPAAAISKPDAKHLTDSLSRELRLVYTPADSLKIMVNIFDLMSREESREFGFKMFEVANRANDTSAALEILRNIAARSVRKDSLLTELYNCTSRYTNLGRHEDTPFVDTDELRETRTFIKLTRNMYQAVYSSEEQRKKLLVDFLQTYSMNPPDNIYDQIILQHAICAILAQLGSSDLLSSKLDELGELINKLPPKTISLRNMYNVHAALLYNDNEEYEKSMQADLNTLEGIKQLEKHYKDNGRVYRNYDANKYVIYCRFLANYPRLAPHEIEKYYKLAMDLVENDYTSAETNEQYPGPQIYYHMAYKNYAQALEFIKKAIDNPENHKYRRRLLRYEIECAEALGDNATLLSASLEYNKILEAYIHDKLDEKFRELQMISDTSELTNSFKRLNIEKELSEARAMKIIIIVTIIAVICLLISVIVLYRLNHRNKALVSTLDKSNRALIEKSENLENSRKDLLKARDVAQKANNLKTDFIKNMSYEVSTPLKAINEYCKLIVDCADASNRAYLERFTSLVELNSELLTTIVNDVLHISEIDSESVPVQNKSTDLRALCTMVLDGVRHRVAPGVALQFDASSPAISLFTDPQRLHQILLNLLTNAAKFTQRGSITLGFSLENDDEGNTDIEKVRFVVTDTGIGIKADKKESIFERFVKLDKETQGAGLGLTISRLLARILGGDVYLDTTYTKGARFVLILPRK